MKNNIQIFKNEMFGEIRTMSDTQGRIFFAGKDVAEALGYSNPQKALRDHVDIEDKGLNESFTPGGKQKVIIINESGLYSLILSSKLEQAKAFKRWVVSEVLPQIRQTGGYIPTRNMRTGEALTAEQVVDQAFNIMQRTISRENLPADGCFSTTELAKEYGMDVKNFYALLTDKGIVKRVSGRYVMTPKYAQQGYDAERIHHSFSLDGRSKVKPYLVWTPMGKDFIKSIL